MPDRHHEPTLTGTVLPSVARILHELASAQSIDDFFGKEGIFAPLFAGTREQMLEAELTAHLGYPPYAASGRTSGNSRHGKRRRNLRTSTGDVTIQGPRDRNGDFQPALLDKYQTSTNELEEKSSALYAKGVSTGPSKRRYTNSMGSRSRPRPSAPSPTKCGRLWKPGRVGPWPPSTRSSTWTRSI